MSLEEKTFFQEKKYWLYFQNNQLLEDFSVIENVAIPLILNNLSKKSSMTKAERILQTLGLKIKKNSNLARCQVVSNKG